MSAVWGHDLLDWWLGQLRGLVKRPVAAHTFPAVDLDPDAADRTSPAGRTSVHLPPHAVLLRPLSPVPLPFADLHAMAEVDLAAHTPLQPADVHVLLLSDRYGTPAHDRYAIVKRSVFGSSSHALPTGLRGLHVATPDGDRSVHPRSLADVFPTPTSRRWVSATIRATLGLALVGSLGTAAHAAWRTEAARSTLGTELTELRRQAVEVRSRLDAERRNGERRGALRRAHVDAVPVTEVIEALTRTLPDSAHATDLVIDGEDLTVSGFARNAANLVGALSRVDVLHDVAFASPVVRLPGEARERFTIRARVGRSAVGNGRDG